MPFVSKAQMRKCFATKGFGQGVNCKEWADATKNKKRLPDKKKPPKSGSNYKYPSRGR